MPLIQIRGKLMLEKTVKKTGDGAHVILPKTWVGSKVKIILLESNTNELDEIIQDKELYNLKEKEKQLILKINSYQKHKKSSIRARVPALNKKLEIVKNQIRKIEESE